jgi:hypothetical protein
MKMSKSEIIAWAILFGLVIWAVMGITEAHAGEFTMAGSAKQDEVNSHAYMVRIEGDVGSWDYQAERSYAETGEITTVDKYLVGVGVDYDVTDRFRVWADEIYQQNIMPEYENLIGGGPKYYLIRTDSWKVSTSTGIMHRWTEYNDEENTSTVLSTRGKVAFTRDKISSKLLLSHIEDLEGAGYVSSVLLSAGYGAEKGFNTGIRLEGEQRPEGTVTQQMLTAGVKW